MAMQNPLSYHHAEFQKHSRQELKDMLDQGIIGPSVNEWAALIAPIIKKDGHV